MNTLPHSLCIACALTGAAAMAQHEHRVHLLDGGVVAHPTTAIDSIHFEQGAAPVMHIQLQDGAVESVALTAIDSAEIAPLGTWTFTDTRDGNTYPVVMIGEQCWMAANLRYLPSVHPGNAGTNTGWYYYVLDYMGTDVNAAMATPEYATYGVLYNWPAAMQGAAGSGTVPSGVQGVCPEGWHLPSDEEVKQLEQFLGMSQSQANNTGYRGSQGQGSRLAGTAALWDPDALAAHPLFGATGFNGLPGSVRSLGAFNNTVGEQFAWWTATDNGDQQAWYRGLHYTQTGVLRNTIERAYGMSVRCVCDQ